MFASFSLWKGVREEQASLDATTGMPGPWLWVATPERPPALGGKDRRPEGIRSP